MRQIFGVYQICYFRYTDTNGHVHMALAAVYQICYFQYTDTGLENKKRKLAVRFIQSTGLWIVSRTVSSQSTDIGAILIFEFFLILRYRPF